MIIYQKAADLWNSYLASSLPLVDEENLPSMEQFFRRRDWEAEREKSWIKFRSIAWLILAQGSYFAAKHSEVVPKTLPVGVAAIGLIHSIYSVRKVEEKIFQMEEYRRLFLERARLIEQESGKNSVAILDFPLPVHIENMLPADLEGFNRNQPIEYFTVGGGRVGIIIHGGRVGVAIDARSITPEVLSHRLRFIADRYPQLSQIKILNFQGNVSKLLGDLLQFKCMSYLCFENCQDIHDEHLEIIHQKAKKLKRIDLIGCKCLSAPICDRMSRKYAITFPDGSSNLDDLFEKFYVALKKIGDDILLKVVKAKIENLERDFKRGETEKRLENLKSLLTLLNSSLNNSEDYERTRSTLMRSAAPDINIKGLDPYEKSKIIKEISSSIDRMINEPYIVVLGSKFKFRAKDIILCDELFKPILQAFHYIDAYLSSLDISDSFLSGHFLEESKGLPINTLVARNLQYLDNDALVHLQGFIELKHVDLSGSPVTDEGLIQHIMVLPKLEVLRLDTCDKITNSALEAAITKLMFQSLQLLTIYGNSKITEATIEKLINKKGIDLTVPFLVAFDKEGIRSVYVSTTHLIDSATIDHFEKIKKDGVVSRILFGEGTRLRFDDIQKLKDLAAVQFFEMKEEQIDVEVLKSLPQIWPIQSILLGKCEIKITQLKSGLFPEAKEVKISTPGELPHWIWDFIGSFRSIKSLVLQSPNCIKNKMDELAKLCVEKKISQLSLNRTDLSNDDLEDLKGKPRSSVLTILSHCSSLDLTGTQVTGSLFHGWKQVGSKRSCSVVFGDGSKKRYQTPSITKLK